MKCIKCEHEINDNAKFCPKCGAKIETTPHVPQKDTMGETCKKCGSEIREDSKFCPKCGDKIGRVPLCPICKKELPPGGKFCLHCGQQIRLPYHPFPIYNKLKSDENSPQFINSKDPPIKKKQQFQYERNQSSRIPVVSRQLQENLTLIKWKWHIIGSVTAILIIFVSLYIYNAKPTLHINDIESTLQGLTSSDLTCIYFTTGKYFNKKEEAQCHRRNTNIIITKYKYNKAANLGYQESLSNEREQAGIKNDRYHKYDDNVSCSIGDSCYLMYIQTFASNANVDSIDLIFRHNKILVEIYYSYYWNVYGIPPSKSDLSSSIKRLAENINDKIVSK